MTLLTPLKPASQTQSTAAANDRDDDNEGEDKGEDGKAETSTPEATRKAGKRAATRPGAAGAESKDYKSQPNPFLLTEQEQELALDRALGREKRGEGMVDEDMPNQEEWDDMGDRNAW